MGDGSLNIGAIKRVSKIPDEEGYGSLIGGQEFDNIYFTGGVIGAGVTIEGSVTSSGYYIDVTHSPYNAVGDGVTDNTAAIQAAIDANPLGTIFIPRSNDTGVYICEDEIILTDASGRDFQGSIISDGATIQFTTTGSAGDTDANMKRGFTSWPTNNGSGGDTSGWSRDDNKAVMSGLIIDGPSHGAGFRLCNSIDATIENCRFINQRYGIAAESTINLFIRRCNFYNHRNAGIGFIYTLNANIWHGVTGAVWNDGYTIEKCGFDWGNVVGALAFILDYGTLSEANRRISGCHSQGANDNSGTQYGYVGRGVLPVIESNWWENVNYPIRIVSSNAAEGGSGTLLTGVTGAEPSGTFAVGAMPDTYSKGCVVYGNFTANAEIAFQLDSNGAVICMGNGTANTGTVDLKSVQGGKTIVDLGNQSYTGSWTTNISYGGYTNVTKLAGMIVEPTAPVIASGFGTSPFILSNDSTSAFLVNVGTGGVALNGLVTMPTSAPHGWIVTCNNLSSRSTTRFVTLAEPVGTNQVRLRNYDNTMTPAAWASGDQIHCIAFAY